MRGFTLIELLIVIGIIAILAAVVLVALNPARQFAQANNSARRTDVTTILNAVGQYQVDFKGALPSAITTTYTEICRTGSTDCTGLVDLSVLTSGGTYLLEIPRDPQCDTVCAAEGIGYEISKNANDRVFVRAPDAQLSQTIEVAR